MLVNNQWVTEEIQEEIKIYLQTNEKNTIIQNLWDIAKAVLRGKFIRTQETRKISNILILHLRNWKKRNKKTRSS